MIDTTRTLALRTLTVAFLSTVSGACTTLGPDYARPPVDAPLAYKEAKGWKTAQPRDDVPRGRWWEIFGDAELNALQARVDVNNPSISAAEARLRQARALTEAARSGQSPAVAAGGTNLDVGVSASWEIDLWGRIRRQVESSDATAQASAGDLEAAKLSIQAQLAQNYFLLRVQDAEIRLLEASEATYGKSLRLARNQYAAGVAARGDVAQAETQLMSTRTQALEAKLARAKYEHAIAVLTSKSPAEFSVAVAPVIANVPTVPPALPSELLERRPDIAAAERRMAAANAQIGVAEAAFYPTVSLFAGGGFGISFGGGLKFAMPLYDAGLRRAESAKVVAAYDETVANYRQAILNGFREVEDNLVTLRILEDEAEVQANALNAARESAAIATNQYRAGVANYLAVVAAQSTALNSERLALSILGRRLVASVGLISALGGGWEADALKQSMESSAALVAQASPENRAGRP